ncbi:MAG: metallophosphoesterase [Planctomycetota bacterium]
MRFLHLSDAYLGARCQELGERARERSDDLRAAFRSAIELALDPKRAIDGVFITGNLFDSHRPDEELWNFAKGLISRLLAKDVRVVIVPGHHDSYAYKHAVWRTERLPGVDLLLDVAPGAPVVHEVHGRRLFLYGVAHVPGQTPTPFPGFRKVEEKGVHVALLHGLDLSAEGSEDQLRFDPATVAPGFDYVALGGRRRYAENRVDETVLVYPGSLEGRGLERDDAGEKGPVIVEIDEGGVHIERVITNRKQVELVGLDLAAERIADADALRDAVGTLAGRDKIVEVTITGNAEFLADLEDIREELAPRFFHLELRDESRIVDSALLRKIESENTIRGYFVRKMNERIAKLRKRISQHGETPELLRKLVVHERAMKLGVEQFIEEEAPADSIYSLIPDDGERVGADELRRRVGVGRLEERVKAMLQHRREGGEAEASTNGNGSSGLKQAESEEGRS